jgi:hypothetical protein
MKSTNLNLLRVFEMSHLREDSDARGNRVHGVDGDRGLSDLLQGISPRESISNN